jgi:ABC-2 type transport system permease protein
MNAIYVLWLRQIKRYLRSKARLIGSVGQPILFLVALGFGFGPIYAQAGQGNYLDFLAPGIIAMGILFTAVFTGIEVIWDKQFGFLKETLVAPVPRWKIMLGRTLGGATISLLQGVIVFLISLFVGFSAPAASLPVAFAFAFLIALFYTALGTAIASRLDDMQGFQLIMNFLVMPTFFLSGALFPLDNLPPAISAVTALNPLSYGVDGLRGALTGVAHYGIATDFLVLGCATLVMLAIGTYCFQKIQA